MNPNSPLWDGNSVDPPLRRPKPIDSTTNSTLQDTRTVSVTNSLNCPKDGVSNFTLSVNAKEWFPPNYDKNNIYNANVDSKSINHRLTKYKIQAQSVEATNEEILSNEKHDEDNSEQRKVLQKLEEIMSNLIVNPGQFDNFVGLFIDILDPHYMDVSFITYIAELLVGKALNEPNFRYNAARLSTIIQEQCPLFRSSLCVLCSKKVTTENDFNLSLFLAELYVQLNYDSIYGDLLIKSLEDVLSRKDGNSIKAVCQVLKLTGASLETKHKEAADHILNKLIASRDSQTLAIKNLIDSVLILRSAKWGQTENNTDVTNNKNQNEDTQVFHDGPTFYGPDGHELSEEECQFLNENCMLQSDNFNDGYDDYSEIDPEMDEEMQAAYDQFLQLGK